MSIICLIKRFIMANDKYVKLIKQYSEDGGNTWYDSNPPEYKRGDLIETDSPDCGAAVLQYRWFAKGEDYYTCDGYNKYYKEWYQYSYDGTNWFDVEPEQTRTGSLIEQNSIDCDYGIEWIPVEDQYICIGIDNNSGNILMIDKPLDNDIDFHVRWGTGYYCVDSFELPYKSNYSVNEITNGRTSLYKMLMRYYQKIAEYVDFDQYFTISVKDLVLMNDANTYKEYYEDSNALPEINFTDCIVIDPELLKTYLLFYTFACRLRNTKTEYVFNNAHYYYSTTMELKIMDEGYYVFDFSQLEYLNDYNPFPEPYNLDLNVIVHKDVILNNTPKLTIKMPKQFKGSIRLYVGQSDKPINITLISPDDSKPSSIEIFAAMYGLLSVPGSYYEIIDPVDKEKYNIISYN